MAWKLSFDLPPWLVRRLDSPALARRFQPDRPPVALEIDSREIVAVAVVRPERGRSRLERYRRIDLAPGLFQPSLLRPPVTDAAAFRAALRAAVDGLPGFDGRVAILLPDRVARITFVELEQLAPSRTETTELLRWKLKRSAPFRVEDARLAWQAFPGPAGAVRCLVALVPLPTLAAIEEAAAGVGIAAGLIDLSSIGLWNLLEPELPARGDALVANAGPDGATFWIARDREPLVVRVKAPAGQAVLGDDEARAELTATLLFHADRLAGSGLKAAFVRAPDPLASLLLAELAGREGLVASRVAVPDGAAVAGGDAALLERLAPALGTVWGG